MVNVEIVDGLAKVTVPKTNRYQRAAQAGQLPLLVPDSTWIRPVSLPDWRGRKLIALDTETKDDWLAADRGAGWAVGAGYIVGVSAAIPNEELYFPLKHPDTENFDRENVIAWLRDHIAAGCVFVMQKASYDAGWIKADFGLDFDTSRLHDTMIEQYMLDENRLEYGLESICRSLGIPGKDEGLLREAAATYGVDPKGGLWKLPARYVGPYAGRDASATLEAHLKLWPKIEEEELEKSYQLEIDLIPMIVAMRRQGIRVDLDYADQLRKELREKRHDVLRELSRKVGLGREITMKDVRSNSFKQQLFDRENLPYPRTEKGAPSFEAKKLAGLQHWLPKMLIQATKYEDAAEKFVSKYVMDYSHLGRIHAEIHTTKDIEEGEGGGTKTSRLAYSDPPLQQAPSRDEELGPAFRSIFQPEPGEMWLAADFSQQEYRLLVHFAYLCKIPGAEDAVRRYQEDPNADFHEMVAKLTGLPRRSAKDANFAVIYGAGVPKFAAMINKTVDEAREIKSTYDTEFPFPSRFAEFCKNRALARGYLKLLDGARAHFDRWEAVWIEKETYVEALRNNVPMQPCTLEEARKRCATQGHPWYRAKLRRAWGHKACNKEIQGSAARQTKLAMRAVWRAGMTPLIQMHDEMGFSTADPVLGRRIVEIMRDAAPLCIPVRVDEEWGRDWGTAKHSWTDACARWPLVA